jgi:hypothetical protein
MRNTWDPTALAIVLALGMLVGTVLATGGLGPGEWRAELDSVGQTVRIDMRPPGTGGQLRISTDVGLSEIGGFDARTFGTAGAPLDLAWRREPGTFVLRGEGGRRPGGEIRFEPNPEFVARWLALDNAPLTGQDLERLAIEDVRVAEIDALHELGFLHVAADDVLRLHSYGVSIEWLADARKLEPAPHLDDVVLLHAQGVSAEEIRDMASLGVGIGIEELIRLHRHGIDASYVGGLVEAGVSADDLDGIVSLHSRGVTTPYVAALRSAGLKDAHVDEIARLHDHGIDTQYVQGMIEGGLTRASIDDLVRLHAHSVPTDYARAILAALRDTDVDSIILLHDHSVGADWVNEMAELGYGRLGPRDLTRLHAHSVSPEFVRALARVGRKDLSADDVIAIRTRGVE